MEGERGMMAWWKGGQTKENHAWFVIRGIPLAILEPLSLSLVRASSSSFPFGSAPFLRAVPSGPETPCFFTGLWDFFHADRRVVHQRGLTCESPLSPLFLSPTGSDSCARSTEKAGGEKGRRERERERVKGKGGETIKKSKCQPP